MTPEQYCQEKAARSGSSFYYSFLFLPPEKRRSITALYAFCREVDDIVDECHDVGVARIKLAWWRTEIANLASGHPRHPVSQALLAAVRDQQISAERLNTIVDGMEMDLTHRRYPDFASLHAYCYRVAGVVGELSASIFGYTDPATLNYARDLGIAFQLTNIIRDVGEDARRNRIYLPQDDLAMFAVDPADILAGRGSPGFTRLMAQQSARARDFYGRALAALPDADRKSQRAGLMMAKIYLTLLDEIENEGFAVLNQRVALTPVRKFWLAWKTWVSA